MKTPNLDRLAEEGTWFKQFYVAATVCSPSRAAFMTSHYPARLRLGQPPDNYDAHDDETKKGDLDFMTLTMDAELMAMTNRT